MLVRCDAAEPWMARKNIFPAYPVESICRRETQTLYFPLDIFPDWKCQVKFINWVLFWKWWRLCCNLSYSVSYFQSEESDRGCIIIQNVKQVIIKENILWLMTWDLKFIIELNPVGSASPVPVYRFQSKEEIGRQTCPSIAKKVGHSAEDSQFVWRRAKEFYPS